MTLVSIMIRWKVGRWICVVGVVITALWIALLHFTVAWTVINRATELDDSAPFFTLVLIALLGNVIVSWTIAAGLSATPSAEYFDSKSN